MDHAKQAAENAIAQSAVAVEQAVEEQMKVAEQKVDEGMKRASEEVDRKLQEANRVADEKRGELEQVGKGCRGPVFESCSVLGTHQFRLSILTESERCCHEGPGIGHRQCCRAAGKAEPGQVGRAVTKVECQNLQACNKI